MADLVEQKNDDTVAETPANKSGRKFIVIAVVVLLAVVALFFYWRSTFTEDTDDAQVDGNLYQVSSRVTGQVIKVYVNDNQQVNQGDLIGKTPHLVKVCSASHIEHLVRQALPGVPLTHVPSPPSSIPMKLHYQYFSLSQGGVAWEAIGRARNFAAYVPGDFPNPQLELIILLSTAG